MRATRTASAAALVATAGLALAGCSLFGSEDSVFNLEVGDCMNVSDLATEVTEVPTIDCAEEHEAEIYAAKDLPDGDFPGDAAISDEVLNYCLEQFDTFVGMAYEESSLDFNAITPSSESWGEGDREIVCYIYELDGSMVTGSLKGAAR